MKRVVTGLSSVQRPNPGSFLGVSVIFMNERAALAR